MERLDKIISSQYNITRSVARKHIRWGKVSVNGKVKRNPSESFETQGIILEYKGQELEYKENIYILMNKPKGVISASEDKNAKTVVDLVPENLKRAGLFPVGRLDKDTTGLLLITDDGDFAHKAISPKNNVPKKYIAQLDGKLAEDMIDKFSDGIVLADGYKCNNANLKIISENVAEVTVTEGKYHQIKRMFGVLNLGVNQLNRVSFGLLCLPETLKQGECIELSKNQAFNIFGG